MQSNEILQARVIANFLQLARQTFGLPARAPVVRTPLGRLRPMLRSLLVAGSLGTALAQPALASDTPRLPAERDTAKSSAKRETASPIASLAALSEKASQR